MPDTFLYTFVWRKCCHCETQYMFLAGETIYCAACRCPFLRVGVKAVIENEEER